MEAKSKEFKKFEEIFLAIEKISNSTLSNLKATSELVFQDYSTQGTIDQDKIIKSLKSKKSPDLLSKQSKARTWLLIGETGMGKGTLVNSILETSKTSQNSTPNQNSSSVDIYASGNVVVIDTPGLFNNKLEIVNNNIVKDIFEKLEENLKCDAGIDCIFLLWSPTVNQNFKFTEIMKQLAKAFGDDVKKSIILLINKNSDKWTEEHVAIVEKLLYSEEFSLTYTIQDVKSVNIDELIEAQYQVQPFKEKEFRSLRRDQLLQMFWAIEDDKKAKEQEKLLNQKIDEVRKEEQAKYEERLRVRDIEYQKTVNDLLEEVSNIARQKEEAEEALKKQKLAFEKEMEKAKKQFQEEKSKLSSENLDSDDAQTAYLEMIRQSTQLEQQKVTHSERKVPQENSFAKGESINKTPSNNNTYENYDEDEELRRILQISKQESLDEEKKRKKEIEDKLLQERLNREEQERKDQEEAQRLHLKFLQEEEDFREQQRLQKEKELQEKEKKAKEEQIRQQQQQKQQQQQQSQNLFPSQNASSNNLFPSQNVFTNINQLFQSEPYNPNNNSFSSVNSSQYGGNVYANSMPNLSYTSSGPLKMDGTPDMRYSQNRMHLSQGPIPLKKDGTPDMRYSVNKKLFGKK